MKSEKSLVVILNKIEDCGVTKGSIKRKALQDKTNYLHNMAKKKAVVKAVSKENLVKKDFLKKNNPNVTTETQRTRSRSNIKENDENKIRAIRKVNLSQDKTKNEQNSYCKRTRAKQILQVNVGNDNLVKLHEKLRFTESTKDKKVLQVDVIRENLVEKQEKLNKLEQTTEPIVSNKRKTRSQGTRGKRKLENNTMVEKGPIQIKLDKFCQIDIVKKPTEEKKAKFYLEKTKHVHHVVEKEKIPEKFVRPKKFVNYAELSLNESTLIKKTPKPTENKIPIYKHQGTTKNTDKIEEDTYEFDSDSEKKKIPKKIPKKRKKLIMKINKNDTNSYDKNMEGVMDRLKKKINKQKVKFVEEKTYKNVPYKNNIPVEEIKEKEQKTDSEVKKVQKIIETNNDLACEEILEPMEIQDDPIDITQDVSNNFGFDAAADSPVQSNYEVLIGSPSFFNRRRPNANSTMLCPPSNSPWRFGEQVGRNPHFLKIKNSALPAIEQEIILDHAFEVKLKEHINQNTAESVKVSIQKSILNFVTIEDSVVKENLHSNSLFDVDQLSPLKKKPNSPRKILGDRNTVNSTPLRGAISKIQQPDLSMIHPNNKNSEEKENSLFGFSNLDDSMQENNQENPLAKPFRFNIDHMKKYVRRKKKVVKVIEEPAVIPKGNEEINFTEESQENNIADVRLFEDPEDRDIKEITLPSRKRTKNMFLSPDEKGKKKAKKQKQDPAFKKWVKDMNSTFAEIDNFELEIE